MELKKKIKADFAISYKEKDMTKKNFLGTILGEIQGQEGNQIESTDSNVMKVLKRFEKGITETIEYKAKTGLPINSEMLELSYLEMYLPVLMKEEELKPLVVAMVEASDNKNIGFLIGNFNKEHSDKSFDNKLLSKIIQGVI